MNIIQKILTGIYILGSLITLAGCNTSAESELATPTPIPTPIVPTKPTYEVQRGNIINQLQFNGRIAPVEEKEIFFRTSGRIRAIYVAKGDDVVEGQILADLELLDNLERQFEVDKLALKRAEINAENAQYHLDLYKLSTSSPELLEALAYQAVAEAEMSIYDAQRAFNITQSTASQADIDAAFAQMILSEQKLEKAQEAFAPYENKPEDNIIRAQLQSKLSAAQRSYNQAVGNYNAMTGTSSEYEQTVAQAQLNTAIARLADAKQKYAWIQSGIGYAQELRLKENEVELAEIQLSETRLGIQELEQSIDDASLTTPSNGNLIFLNVTEGMSVEAYNTYGIVADLTQLEIRADLVSDDTIDLEEGMLVTATLINNPGQEFTGKIRRLPYNASSNISEEDMDNSTRVSLDQNPFEIGLELGDLMRITVILEKKDNVLWLPPQAIRNFEGRNFVVVQDGEYQVRVDVKIGINAEDKVEILEGLEEGQIVIDP